MFLYNSIRLSFKLQKTDGRNKTWIYFIYFYARLTGIEVFDDDVLKIVVIAKLHLILHFIFFPIYLHIENRYALG